MELTPCFAVLLGSDIAEVIAGLLNGEADNWASWMCCCYIELGDLADLVLDNKMVLCTKKTIYC